VPPHHGKTIHYGKTMSIRYKSKRTIVNDERRPTLATFTSLENGTFFERDRVLYVKTTDKNAREVSCWNSHKSGVVGWVVEPVDIEIKVVHRN
jgi:hypothetical protein